MADFFVELSPDEIKRNLKAYGIVVDNKRFETWAHEFFNRDDGRTFEGKVRRLLVARELYKSDMEYQASEYLECQHPDLWSRASVCTERCGYKKPLPHRCNYRFCEECEHNAMIKRLRQYYPRITKAVRKRRVGYTLKKIELTTPFSLFDPDAPRRLREAWRAVAQTMNDALFHVLDKKRLLTPAERRRGRVDLNKHDIGDLIGGEYGPKGLKLHFHILIYGPYIPQSVITNAWKARTGNTCEITYIQKVKMSGKGIEKAIKEVAKYASKLTKLKPSAIPRLAKVLKGTRRIRAHGVFYGGSEPPEVPVCPRCNALTELISRHEYEQMVAREKMVADPELHLTLQGKFGDRAPPMQPKMVGLEKVPVVDKYF